MIYLYLVRHGENRANITKEFSHRLIDYSLTLKGELQAHQTGEYLAGRKIEAVFCSPLLRAVETAAIIAAHLKLPFMIVENFREVNVGALERVPPSRETWAEHDLVIAAWRRGDLQARFPEGENYYDLWRRYRDGLVKIAAEWDGHHVMIVGHGGLFQFTIRDLCPQVDLDWLYARGNGNCSISEILLDLRAGEPVGELVRWADFSHLHGEAACLVSGLPDGDTFAHSQTRDVQ